MRPVIGTAGAVDPAMTTFVFVTPRRWNAKTKWLKTRRAEKFWRDVRVLDVDDLEAWLEPRAVRSSATLSARAYCPSAPWLSASHASASVSKWRPSNCGTPSASRCGEPTCAHSIATGHVASTSTR
jgi:hypothetical protein